MQYRAFRLYLFAAAALLRRCFSASAPKTALVLFKRQKGYRFNRCPKKFLTHVLILRPYRRNWLWGGGENLVYAVYFTEAVMPS